MNFKRHYIKNGLSKVCGFLGQIINPLALPLDVRHVSIVSCVYAELSELQLPCAPQVGETWGYIPSS